MPENQTLQRLNYIIDMYFEFLVLFLIEYPCAGQELLE